MCQDFYLKLKNFAHLRDFNENGFNCKELDYTGPVNLTILFLRLVVETNDS
jgi:hypothetical protein